jgi:hypothetical protein
MRQEVKSDRRDEMPISKFFKHPDNSGIREKIFFHRLYYELTLAAAHRGAFLQVFTPEVDREGFDIVLDDGEVSRRFQLKSFVKSARTASWKIQRRLLRPERRDAEALGFEFSPTGTGLGGGVILIKIDDSDDSCPVSYFYTDVFVLTALADEMIVSKRPARARQARNLISELRQGRGREPVPVPAGVFFKIRSASCLLAAAGFHSTEETYLWGHKLLSALRQGFRMDERSSDSAFRAKAAPVKYAISGLMSLVDEPDLSSF